MSRDPSLYVEDILEACERVQAYVEGLDQEAFLADRMRFDAVVRNLELVGEAARQLPDDVRAAMPDVPWREVIGMRNLLIHAYFGIDPDIVWGVATEEVGAIVASVTAWLGDR